MPVSNFSLPLVEKYKILLRFYVVTIRSEYGGLGVATNKLEKIMDIMSFKRALVLAPHTDDGELGAGGTIARLIEAGVEMYYAAFSTAEQSVPAGYPKDILKTEVRNATLKLGIKSENLLIYNYEVRKLNYLRQEILEELIRLRSEIKPDLIFMPSLHDIHQDHTTIAQEGLRAFKQKTILGYELIWNNLTFSTTCFVKLNEEHIARKCMALKEYASQKHRDYLSEDFIRSLARTRGVQVGCDFAESFEVIRLMI
jgi:LmbE family N-acetylglucosaminyl deacetylase